MAFNPALLALAQHRVWRDVITPMEKIAVVPPDPAAAGGMPPGGAPPMDPAMAGGAPPMDPAMMGGAPPMDPAMMGGAPPMDPAMMGGMPPPGAPPMDPAMAGAAPVDPAAAAAGGQKMKPEQMMQMLDFRLYNMQQQLTAIMNAHDITLPPGALITPPGSPTPVAEAAVPGGPQDPSMSQAGGEGNSAISAIGEIQGASPELAMGGGGGAPMGGGEKMGTDFSALVEKMTEIATPVPAAVNKSAAAVFAVDIANRAPSRVGTPFEIMQEHRPMDNATAVAAMLRTRTAEVV